MVINTLSPPGQQLPGPLRLDDEEIRIMYSAHVWGGFPCPTEMFVALIHLTHLRTQAFTGELTEAAMTAQVNLILNTVSTVDVNDWMQMAATYSSNTAELAEVFRMAIVLHGILALPRRAVVSWARLSSEHTHITSRDDKMSVRLDAYMSVRLAYQKALLQAMQELAPKVSCRCCMSWPLLVTGVAVSDGHLDSVKAFVEESFQMIAAEPAEGGCALLTLRKFRAFWATGKMGWDDCFQEPFIVRW